MGYEAFALSFKSKNNSDFKKYLQNPNLLVCDEGHRLSSFKSDIYQHVQDIRTKRKIILTGTPFQNNVDEIYSLGNLIKNGMFGTLPKFKTLFRDPIEAGQYRSSSKAEVEFMKGRVFVLQKILNKFIQRKDVSILAPKIPPKLEFVMYIPLSELQAKLYKVKISNYFKYF